MFISVVVLCSNERTGWINPHLFSGLFTLFTQGTYRGHRLAMKFMMEWPVEWARNRCGMFALENGSEFLLMIDNDQIIPDNFIEMIELCEKEPDVDIVTGWTWNHCPDSHLPGVNNYGAARFPQSDGFQQVAGSGGGVLLIRRKVLESLPQPWFRVVFSEIGKPLAGEDLYFCQAATQFGFKIHTHKKFPCGHLKTVDLQKIAKEVGFNLYEQPMRRFYVVPRAVWAESIDFGGGMMLPRFNLFSHRTGSSGLHLDYPLSQTGCCSLLILMLTGLKQRGTLILRLHGFSIPPAKAI